VLLPEFLMFALMAEGEDIRRFGRGTTHTTIYYPEVKALHICLPPVEEQHLIVDQVESGLIEADRTQSALATSRHHSTSLRSSILASAFSGKLVPQDPSDEPASILLRRIAEERATTSKTRHTRKPHTPSRQKAKA
jgi:type I restriction enzyme S subunit